MRPAAVAAVTIALAAAAAPVAAKEAKCLLEYEGETYINETCSFTPRKGGSFVIRTFDEMMHQRGEMVAKYIATIDVENGRATGNWSGEPYAYHVHNPLGDLRRSDADRACWVSDIARVCAW